MAAKAKTFSGKGISFNFGANKKSSAKPRKSTGVRVHKGIAYGS